MKISIYAIPGLLDRPNEQRLFERVCSMYNCNPTVVRANNDSRKRDYVEIRQLSIALFKQKLNLSFTEAGRFFEKDHSTAIHAVTTVNNLRETNRIFREKTEHLFN